MAAKTADPFAVQNVAIDSIVPHERNPNQGDVGAVATAIAIDGWHGTVLCQAPDGDRAEPRIVAGHTRWRALAMLQEHGYTYPEGGHVSYEELAARVPLPPAGTVPVQQLPMDDVRATRKMLADNRASALALTDDTEIVSLLTALAEEPDGLLGSLFDGDDIDLLIADIAANDGQGGPPAPDDAPSVPDEPITHPGDLWVLGDHRLYCGDSRVPGSFERVLDGALADMIWTDPPYGVAYGEKNRFLQTIGRSDRLEEDIAGDEIDPVALAALLAASFDAAIASTRPGAVWFVAAPPGPQLGVFAAELLRLKVWRQMLCWVKNAPVFGRSDYHYQHETLFYGWTPGAAHQPPPTQSTSSLWHFDRPMASKLHPTMKPVALIAEAVRNHSKPGGLILDFFAGSGSTLAACEQEGRQARCIELAPGYCDVIVGRWEALTGKKADRHAATSEGSSK